MGYSVSMEFVDVFIPRENIDWAFIAIQELQNHPEQMGGSSSFDGKTTEKFYSWVDNARIAKAQSLGDLLGAWRYNSCDDGCGNIILEGFVGDKLGDDEILWKALAPFVNPDAVIYCVGEDDARWKWTFADGKFKDTTGRIVYDD